MPRSKKPPPVQQGFVLVATILHGMLMAIILGKAISAKEHAKKAQLSLLTTFAAFQKRARKIPTHNDRPTVVITLWASSTKHSTQSSSSTYSLIPMQSLGHEESNTTGTLLIFPLKDNCYYVELSPTMLPMRRMKMMDIL